MSLKNRNSKKETFWSRFAKDFEQRNNYVVGKKEIENVKENLLQYKHLGVTLELGCGDGVFSKTISQNANQLIATDWSDEMIESAKINLSGFESVQVQKENCFDLSFNDNTFDTVFMANLLHIIPEPENALVESKRVLKDNGQIIILSFTLHGMSLFNKLAMLFRYIITYGKPPKHSRTLTVLNVKKLLEDQGFQVQEANLIGTKIKSVLAVAKNTVNL